MDPQTITVISAAIAGAAAGVLGAWAKMRLAVANADMTEAKAKALTNKANAEIEETRMDRIEERLAKCDEDREDLRNKINEMEQKHVRDLAMLQAKFFQMLYERQVPGTNPAPPPGAGTTPAGAKPN